MISTYGTASDVSRDRGDRPPMMARPVLAPIVGRIRGDRPGKLDAQNRLAGFPAHVGMNHSRHDPHDHDDQYPAEAGMNR